MKKIKILINKSPSAPIILFGGFSRGEDTLNSDIDIAVIRRKEKELNLIEYKKRFQRAININYYASFQKIHKHLKENMKAIKQFEEFGL